jgi:8-oxo-dGTP diphosphatase
MKTILIAAAIVRDDAGRFLLVRKRGSEIFFQPGGKIDAGEKPETALIREIAERAWDSH